MHYPKALVGANVRTLREGSANALTSFSEMSNIKLMLSRIKSAKNNEEWGKQIS
jgi:hypothetical protein